MGVPLYNWGGVWIPEYLVAQPHTVLRFQPDILLGLQSVALYVPLFGYVWQHDEIKPQLQTPIQQQLGRSI